jgi:hypothetical protein
MPALSTWSPEDGLLGVVAPLALAASVGTALVVDLDPRGAAFTNTGSLATLVEEGPRRTDLEPSRSGVALLSNGGVSADAARGVLDALITGWPAVVFRLPGDRDRPAGPGVVPVYPLVPSPAGATAPPFPAVYQQTGWGTRPPGPGVVVPRPSRASVRMLLDGTRPPRGRWLRAWAQVWSRSWA